jgi:hypothetical protein
MGSFVPSLQLARPSLGPITYRQKPYGPANQTKPRYSFPLLPLLHGNSCSSPAASSSTSPAAAMLRLRSSARLLRKLCEASRPLGRREVQGAGPPALPTRWLSGTASAARTTSLLRPLPGLDLPPSLPDKLTRLPTRITTLPNGVRVASEDVPVLPTLPPSSLPSSSHSLIVLC